MNNYDIEAAFAAANPLTADGTAALSLNGAEIEMLESIVSTPLNRRSAAPREARPRSRRTMVPGRRRLALLAAATAVIAAALALLPSGERTGGPPPAFAASLVRLANNSPLVLLRAPGWHVVYTYEQPGGYGEMHFVRGPATANGMPRDASDTPRPVSGAASSNRPKPISNMAPAAGRVASLIWTKADRSDRRYLAGGHQHARTDLGVSVRRYVYEGGTKRAFDITASFIYRGRVLSFRATVSSMSMFRSELRALTAVDTTTWLKAMPPSVVNSANSSHVVHDMLRGIPLPKGFNASRIRGSRLVQNRYDLGAAVTGTIACMWFADWNRARHAGDQAAVKHAIAAMSTAPHWPVLRQMASQGGWSQVLIQYAQAMRQGKILGGRWLALTPAVIRSGLGCSQWGVKLGR